MKASPGEIRVLQSTTESAVPTGMEHRNRAGERAVVLRCAADAVPRLLMPPGTSCSLQRTASTGDGAAQCLSCRMQHAAFIFFPLNSRSEGVSGGGGRG